MFASKTLSRGCSRFLTTRSGLLGGMDEKHFKLIVENGTPFSNDNQKYEYVSCSTKGDCRVRLPFQKNFIGNVALPAIHGGVISSLIDHCAGFGAWSLLPNISSRVSTQDLHVSFLSAGPAEDIIAAAQLVNEGKRIIVMDVKVYAEANPDKLIAVGRGTFYRMNASEDKPEDIIIFNNWLKSLELKSKEREEEKRIYREEEKRKSK